MFFNKKLFLFITYWCFVSIIRKINLVSAFGPYPYPPPGYYPSYPAFPFAPPAYPPPLFTPPYSPYYPPSCYAPPPPIPPQPQTCGYQKPKYVKPLRIPSTSPLILPTQGGYSNTPIIISSKPKSQPPGLLSPLTNLINSLLRGIVSPRSSCDCDNDY